ncbi:MAG: hypothetical protein K6U74_16925, partial [Firmicutes bacterium]|nr:hypothetical protein [Bacillota bacterium]
MRTLRTVVIVFLLLLALPAYANTVTVERIAGTGVHGQYVDGPASEAQFYQPTLVVWDRDGDGVYALDGVSIRRIEGGQVETITSLWKIKDQLDEYGLGDEATIWSFRYGNMNWYGDKLYLSGLMFKKDVKPLPNLSPQSSAWTREGFTWNVFFEIDPATSSMRLLRADKAYCNIVPRRGNYISGLWDSRPDLIPHEGKFLYAYYF